jgi:hypothetical protein
MESKEWISEILTAEMLLASSCLHIGSVLQPCYNSSCFKSNTTIVDVNVDSCNDLVRLVTVCCCKFGQSPCMTYLYGCQEYLKDTVEHDSFLDATWCAGLEDPAIYSTQSHRKTWHVEFCCTTRGIDVPACTTELYTFRGTGYPICGYQSSNGMLQDSEFKIGWGYFVMHLSYTITTVSCFWIRITSIGCFKQL